MARALSAYAEADAPAFENVSEVPGQGIEATGPEGTWRLGRRDRAPGAGAQEGDRLTSTTLSLDGHEVATFRFTDRLRPDAAATVAALKDAGLEPSIVSGDQPGAVADIAARLRIDNWTAGMLPAGKLDRVTELSQAGRKVLMVGDGLNDAPALKAAHVSIAPATAADIGRNAADFVFLREGLDAVGTALTVSRRSGRLIRENFAIAVVYNIIAVPLAITGHVTPLIAALAMSGSSVLVITNAMRLLAGSGAKPDAKEAASPAGGRVQPGE